MIELTRKYIHRLLDIGVRSLVDIAAYDFMSCRATQRNKTIKVKFSELYKDIEKGCSEFTVSERNIYRIFHRLVKVGLLEVVMMGYGEALVKVNFLHELFGQKGELKTDVSEEKTPEPRDSEKIEKSRIKQQQLILTKQICQQNGINYRLDRDWWEIASHGIEKIQATIKRMEFQLNVSLKPIFNVPGWFRVALRDNFYLDQPDDEIDELRMLSKAYEYVRNRYIDLVGCLPICT